MAMARRQQCLEMEISVLGALNLHDGFSSAALLRSPSKHSSELASPRRPAAYVEADPDKISTQRKSSQLASWH